MWKKIYNQALPFVVLFAPLMSVNLALDTLLHSAYIPYVAYFLSFYTLLVFIVDRDRVAEFTDGNRLVRFGWYLVLLITAGILIVALDIIRNGPFPPTVFYSCLGTATLLGLRYSLDSQQVFWRSVLLTLSCYIAVVMTGFEAIGFHYYPATSLFSFAIASVVTGQYILSEMTESYGEISERVREAKTRNQKRKWKVHASAFSDTRPTRLTAGILLLLGPITISTLAMTPLLEARFMLTCLALMPARSILVSLLPNKEAIEFPADFLFHYTGICYLFIAMIPVLKTLSFL